MYKVNLSPVDISDQDIEVVTKALKSGWLASLQDGFVSPDLYTLRNLKPAMNLPELEARKHNIERPV